MSRKRKSKFLPIFGLIILLLIFISLGLFLVRQEIIPSPNSNGAVPINEFVVAQGIKDTSESICVENGVTKVSTINTAASVVGNIAIANRLTIGNIDYIPTRYYSDTMLTDSFNNFNKFGYSMREDQGGNRFSVLTINKDGQRIGSFTADTLRDKIVRVDDFLSISLLSNGRNINREIKFEMPLITKVERQDDFFVGNLNIMKVEINNPTSETFESKLLSWVQETSFGSISYLTKDQIIISPGDNEYEIIIPDLPLSSYEFNVVPVRDEFISPAIISTCDFRGGTIDKDSGEVFIQLSEKQQELFIINPIPLWLLKDSNGICPVGYEPQKDEEGRESNTLCIREDLGDLACFQTGCPVTASFSYECTSSGLCAETVFKAGTCSSDSDCPSDMKCDVDNTGVCWKEVVRENAFSCNIANDCPIPCKGLTATCSDQTCGYAGQCETPPEEFLINDCNLVGCGTGEFCNSNTGICEASGEVVTKDTSNNNLIWIIFSILSLLVLILLIVAFRKSKK